MKVDVTDAERNFASMSAGMNTFVMNMFASYDEQIKLLAQQVKDLSEKNSQLQKELENKECAECKS